MREFRHILQSVRDRRRRGRKPEKRSRLKPYADSIFVEIQAGSSISAIHEALTIYLEGQGEESCSLNTLIRFVKEQRPDLYSFYITPNKVGYNKKNRQPVSDQLAQSASSGQAKKGEEFYDPPAMQTEDSGATAAKGKPEKKIEVKTAPGRRKRWEDMTEEEQNAEVAEDIKRLQNPLKYMNGEPTDE